MINLSNGLCTTNYEELFIVILKEVTAAEAGLTKEQQYELIFKAILDKGSLTTDEIYSVINAELQKECSNSFDPRQGDLESANK